MSDEKKVEMKVKQGGDVDVDQSRPELQAEARMMYSQELRGRMKTFISQKMNFKDVMPILREYADNGRDRVAFSFILREETIIQLNDEGIKVEETKDPVTGSPLSIVSW